MKRPNKSKDKPNSRYHNQPDGKVAQFDGTPQEQLQRLDDLGFVAKKERAKIDKKIKLEKSKAKKSK